MSHRVRILKEIRLNKEIVRILTPDQTRTVASGVVRVRATSSNDPTAC